jgi:microcystin-dependent protein
LQAFAGANAPTGWLLCDGSQQPIATYPELYSVLSTTYGALTNGSGGAGSSHFRVPDLRGRTPVGAGNENVTGNNTNRVLGVKGGDIRMPQHNHGITDPGHSHNYGVIGNGQVGGGVVTPTNSLSFTQVTATSTTGVSVNNAGTGSGANMPPFLVTNYIIKATSSIPRGGTALGSTPPIVTALPVNPQFGEVVTYAADATNGVYWTLQYDASGTYPWKFVGGAPLYDAGGGYQPITSTSYVDLSGVAVSTALAGDYDVRLDAQLQQPNNNGYVTYLSVSYSGGTLSDYTYPIVYAPSTGGTDSGASRTARILNTAASNIFRGRARVNAGTGYVGYCRLTVTPVRVAA